MLPAARAISGCVYKRKRQRGDQWYVQYRLPDGRQVQKRLGPVWTQRGRPPEGYYTRATAKAALDAILVAARRGTLPGLVRTDATFADAAEAWHAHGSTPRPAGKGWKPTTRRDYRSQLDVHLLPQFGELRFERITQREIEQWLVEKQTDGTLPPRTAHKSLTVMHAIMARACKQYGLPINPVASVERHAPRYDAGRYSFFTLEEVHALARAAGTPPTDGDTPSSAQQLAAAKQDATIILTAAFSGLRLGELLALRVRDVDFGAQAIRVLGSVDVVEGVGTPKSGHGRVVPLVPDLAIRLAQLLERDSFTSPDDYLFVGESGDHLDGSALRRRFKAARDRAKLPPLRFHDLRHTFGSLAINEGSTREVQQWLGHADARTTQRYLHYKRRADEAQRLARAFTAAGSALQPFTHDSTANPRLL